MSDEFLTTVSKIESKGLLLIEDIKQGIVVAMEDLKRANKELEECPKEDAIENAQLQTARENQAKANHKLFMLQKRLEAFEKSLTNYTPIGVITMGTTVKLVLESIDGNAPDGIERTFILRVVHRDASDVANGFIAETGKVGHAIMGHVEGDIISINAPHGTLCYKIERVY